MSDVFLSHIPKVLTAPLLQANWKTLVLQLDSLSWVLATPAGSVLALYCCSFRSASQHDTWAKSKVITRVSRPVPNQSCRPVLRSSPASSLSISRFSIPILTFLKISLFLFFSIRVTFLSASSRLASLHHHHHSSDSILDFYFLRYTYYTLDRERRCQHSTLGGRPAS